MTSTISFPLYTTTLVVAWLTNAIPTLSGDQCHRRPASYTRTLESIVLTILQGDFMNQDIITLTNSKIVTTNTIVGWNVELSDTQLSTTPTFKITSSVLPPTFTMTDDWNPKSESGVRHLSVTRTITPTPYPYSQTAPNPNFSFVTFKRGPSPPQCKVGCGRQCLMFCPKPCLIGCGPGGGSDFPDPVDPDPPNNPNQNKEDLSSGAPLERLLHVAFNAL